MAARAGYRAIAITDHDNLNGVDEAVSVGEHLGLEVVPGIELSTDYAGTEVHILGYFVDPGAESLSDLLAVALREVREETGVQRLRPVTEDIYSLEVLTVDGHEKHGKYVPSHLHLNLTYLLEAEEDQPLRVCEAENSGVAWFSLADALSASTEPWFVERIYKKLNEKLKVL